MTPDLLFAAGITVLLLIGQFTARRVRAISYLWVALLIGHGFLPPGPIRTTPAGLAFLVLGLTVSVWFGYWRGRTMPMWRDTEGRLHRKGGRITALLWLATFAVRIVLVAAAQAAFGEPFNAGALWLGVGVTFGVQQAVLTYHGRTIPRPAPELPSDRRGRPLNTGS